MCTDSKNELLRKVRSKYSLYDSILYNRVKKLKRNKHKGGLKEFTLALHSAIVKTGEDIETADGKTLVIRKDSSLDYFRFIKQSVLYSNNFFCVINMMR